MEIFAEKIGFRTHQFEGVEIAPEFFGIEGSAMMRREVFWAVLCQHSHSIVTG
jgi:hypothetical protein